MLEGKALVAAVAVAGLGAGFGGGLVTGRNGSESRLAELQKARADAESALSVARTKLDRQSAEIRKEFEAKLAGKVSELEQVRKSGADGLVKAEAEAARRLDEVRAEKDREIQRLQETPSLKSETASSGASVAPAKKAGAKKKAAGQKKSGTKKKKKKKK